MTTTTTLHPHPVPSPTPLVRYLGHCWWTCHSAGRHTWRNRCDALLAIGQLLSVIPRAARESLDLVIEPEAGWRGQVPTWLGVPCRIGRATLWLPVDEEPGRHRDLSFLALLPRHDLDDAPPFIQIGTQFLLEHRIQTHLDATSTVSPGRLTIP